MPNQHTTHKTCKSCSQSLPVEEFYFKDKKKTRREPTCKECKKKHFREGYDPFKASDRWLKSQYGITNEDRTRMWNEQKGVCKICKKPGDGRWKQLCVDHDHQTGKVRDLLCRRCNTVLGEVYDDPNILLGMVEYLTTHINQQQELSEPQGWIQ